MIVCFNFSDTYLIKKLKKEKENALYFVLIYFIDQYNAVFCFDCYILRQAYSSKFEIILKNF